MQEWTTDWSRAEPPRSWEWVWSEFGSELGRVEFVPLPLARSLHCPLSPITHSLHLTHLPPLTSGHWNLLLWFHKEFPYCSPGLPIYSLSVHPWGCSQWLLQNVYLAIWPKLLQKFLTVHIHTAASSHGWKCSASSGSSQAHLITYPLPNRPQPHVQWPSCTHLYILVGTLFNSAFSL